MLSKIHGQKLLANEESLVSSIEGERSRVNEPCVVCGDYSTGTHYGVLSCDGCSGFFKRAIRKEKVFVCKNVGKPSEGNCIINRALRNQCPFCRYKKCVSRGMLEERVQTYRGPRGPRILHPASVSRRAHPSLSTPLPSQGDPLVPPSCKLTEFAAASFFEMFTWTRCQIQFIRLPVAQQITSLQQSWPVIFLLQSHESGAISQEKLLTEASSYFPIIPKLEVAEAYERIEALNLDHQEIYLLKMQALVKGFDYQLSCYEARLKQEGYSVRLKKCLDLLNLVHVPVERVLFKPLISAASMSQMIADLIQPSQKMLSFLVDYSLKHFEAEAEETGNA